MYYISKYLQTFVMFFDLDVFLRLIFFQWTPVISFINYIWNIFNLFILYFSFA